MSKETSRRQRALFALLRPAARRWVWLSALVAGATAITLTAPLVLRRIVDQIVHGTDAGAIRSLGLVLLGLAIAGQVMSVVVSKVSWTVAWDTTNRLRMQLTEHVLGLDHEFHRSHTPGELISRVDGDVTSVSDFLGKVVTKVGGAVMQVTGIIVVLMFIDVRLGLAMIAYFVAATIAVLWSRSSAVDESTAEMGANARLYGGIEERLNAAEDIRANGAGEYAMARFVDDSQAVMATAVRRAAAFMRMWWTIQMSVAVGTVGAIAGSGWLVARGSISVGTAFLLFQYVLLIAQPLEEMIHELETVQKATGAMVRVVDLLAVRAGVVDNGAISPPAGALSVDFRDVSFDYGDGDGDEARPVLTHVDLTIAAGRSVGVIGRTGSGKTTCSRLILRLVEATSGELRVGGVPIADIPLTELRHRSALVPQDVELFAGTVGDNVTLFDPRFSDDEVEAAIRAVGLDTLADGGIDRELGAGGTGMSAGEAQLVAMARVWLRSPDLVVLDEATARVDPETEARLDAAVRRLVAGRTAIIIAHRLSTLRAVDDIAVFDHGRVVEFGPRADLAANPDSRYRQLLDMAMEEALS